MIYTLQEYTQQKWYVIKHIRMVIILLNALEWEKHKIKEQVLMSINQAIK